MKEIIPCDLCVKKIRRNEFFRPKTFVPFVVHHIFKISYIYFHQHKSKMRHKIKNQNPDFQNIDFNSNSENYIFEKDGLELKSKYTAEDVKNKSILKIYNYIDYLIVGKS